MGMPNPDMNNQQQTIDGRKVVTKPFLKRKTKTMKAQKVNWNTKSRIDCWNKPDAPVSTTATATKAKITIAQAQQ